MQSARARSIVRAIADGIAAGQSTVSAKEFERAAAAAAAAAAEADEGSGRGGSGGRGGPVHRCRGGHAGPGGTGAGSLGGGGFRRGGRGARGGGGERDRDQRQPWSRSCATSPGAGMMDCKRALQETARRPRRRANAAAREGHGAGGQARRPATTEGLVGVDRERRRRLDRRCRLRDGARLEERGVPCVTPSVSCAPCMPTARTPSPRSTKSGSS